MNIFSKLKAAGGVGLVAFALAMTYSAGTKPPAPPPVVVEEGIKITAFSVTKDGISIEWETTDERIKNGDEYIIEYKERQIPARTGWSGWKEAGRTVAPNTKFAKGGFWRDRDCIYRVRVNKGAIAK